MWHTQMEVHTAVKASSSSSMQMQLNEQIKFDKLSITENSYEEIERDQFINKAKKEINNFTRLIREFLKGSLNIESIAPFDVEILDIHWNRISSRDVIETNDAVTYISIDLDEDKLEVALDDFIGKSIRPVKRIIMSDEYPSLHDDLKALLIEQYNWEMPGLDISSGSDSDSEDKGMILD